MVVWSAVARGSSAFIRYRNMPIAAKLTDIKISGISLLPVRHCKSLGPKFYIVDSNFSWNKVKDMLHFYTLLGLIPVLGVLVYANVFIGPATLQPIPEGYNPKPWEYHSNPVTRFISRYIVENPQKSYEKTCFKLFYEREKQLAREVEKRVKFLIKDRRDFQSWYYTPAMTKYSRHRAKAVQDFMYVDKRENTFPIHY